MSGVPYSCMGRSLESVMLCVHLALAEKNQDDPDLMQICEEAYRQRGRPLTEGE